MPAHVWASLAIKLTDDSDIVAFDKADNKKLEALNNAVFNQNSRTRAHMPYGQGTSTLEWGGAVRLNLSQCCRTAYHGTYSERPRGCP